MASQNPLLYDLIKTGAAIALRRKGYGRSDIQSALDSTTGETIDAVAAQAAVTYPPLTGTGAPSGGIIAAILAFLSSPEGQALLAALVQMLISLIGGG